MSFYTILLIAKELLRGKVLSMKFRWMLKCVFSMYKDLVIGGRCETPPYLLAINFNIPLYI